MVSLVDHTDADQSMEGHTPVSNVNPKVIKDKTLHFTVVFKTCTSGHHCKKKE